MLPEGRWHLGWHLKHEEAFQGERRERVRSSWRRSTSKCREAGNKWSVRANAGDGHAPASLLVCLTLALAHPSGPCEGFLPSLSSLASLSQPFPRCLGSWLVCSLRPSPDGRHSSFYLRPSGAWRGAWHKWGLRTDLSISGNLYSTSALGGGGQHGSLRRETGVW